jgi:hypothetical protein
MMTFRNCALFAPFIFCRGTSGTRGTANVYAGSARNEHAIRLRGRAPFITFLLFLALSPASAQIQFSGQIANPISVDTLASPVYYNETVTAISVSNSNLAVCNLDPVISVYVQRNGAALTLASGAVLVTSLATGR